MPTIMLGTCSDRLNVNFTRLGAAADMKLLGGAIVTHPPLPGYTATLGLVYGTDEVENRNWDIFDQAIATGSTTRKIRFTADDAQNVNLRRILVTLAAASIVIPTESDPEPEPPDEQPVEEPA
jgi:hypothetical protein